MTPADIAARAAAVAAEWTPGAIEAESIGWATGRWLLDAIEALLADRERLRGAIAARHRPAEVDGDCTCGASLIDAGCPLCEWECWVWADEEQTSTELCRCAVDAHAAHVAAILDGGGA